MFHWNKSRDMGSVVNGIMKRLRRSKLSFDAAAAVMDLKTRAEPELNAAVRMCLDNYRTFVTGLLEWCLASDRYKMWRYAMEDGSLEIPL